MHSADDRYRLQRDLHPPSEYVQPASALHWLTCVLLYLYAQRRSHLSRSGSQRHMTGALSHSPAEKSASQQA